MELATFNHKPYFAENVDAATPYIVAVRPHAESVEIEWIYANGRDGDKCNVHFSVDGGVSWQSIAAIGKTVQFAAPQDAEIVFFVECDGKQSNVRKARTGLFPCEIVNYLHPNDKQYERSGNYLGSPSIARLDDGTLFVLHDVFGEGEQNLSILFRSDDDGVTWQYVTDIFPLFWATLFVYDGKLCAVGCDKEYGDMQVVASDDSFATWQGVTLAHGSFKTDMAGFHRSPDPVVEYGGRLWVAMEYGSWKRNEFCPSVWSISLGDNILDASKWQHTPNYKFDFSLDDTDAKWGGIEGNLVVAPDGKLLNILRHDKRDALVLEIDVNNPTAELTYVGKMPFDLCYTKFHIQRVNTIYCAMGNPTPYRNRLDLYLSDDCNSWRKHATIVDMTELSPELNAAQYPSFVAHNGTLYIAVRVAACGAKNYHDSNCICFCKYRIDV